MTGPTPSTVASTSCAAQLRAPPRNGSAAPRYPRPCVRRAVFPRDASRFEKLRRFDPFDRRQNIRRRFFGHSVQPQRTSRVRIVEIRNASEPLRARQAALDRACPEPSDIHHVPAGEQKDTLRSCAGQERVLGSGSQPRRPGDNGRSTAGASLRRMMKRRSSPVRTAASTPRTSGMISPSLRTRAGDRRSGYPFAPLRRYCLEARPAGRRFRRSRPDRDSRRALERPSVRRRRRFLPDARVIFSSGGYI
jgi:hypothetical protein